MAAERRRVAILGGGIASLAAAHELTSTAGLRARHQVTVYQLGWRLGGKGASGRNAAVGQRIEEHGLHIWFGFYDNAFRLIRDCYSELGRSRDQPLATWRDAFGPCDHIVLYEQVGQRWRPWQFDVPRNPQVPGEPARLPGFWEMARDGLAWLWSRWAVLRAGHPLLREAAPGLPTLPRAVERAAAGIAHRLARLLCSPADHLLHAALRTAEEAATRTLAELAEAGHPERLCEALTAFRDWLWARVVAGHQDDDDLRLFFTMLDVATTIARGVVADDLVRRGFGAADGSDLREWLRHHGANQLTVERSPLIRAIYDMAFAYEAGDVSRPVMAAGTALRDMARLFFTYRGAFSWKLQAGMGDTIFAPLYEVLRRRGVRFRFFNRVSRLRLSADRRSVEAIEVQPQVRLAGAEYSPLMTVRDLPCWPNQPLWDQLVDGDRLRDAGLDLESEDEPDAAAPLVLRRGTDFDLAVLGIPVGALSAICGELIEDRGNPRFRAMLERSRTVMTQALQLWLDRPVQRLGWTHPEDCAMTAYVEPLDSYAGMAHLLPREDWGWDQHVADVAYFCGVLPDRPRDTRARATERARRSGLAFLERDVTRMWPASRLRGSSSIDWELLVDPARRRGRARFEAQFWRANFQPTERYVLTPPGSVEHRLRADESGYDNLFLAGDWMRTGLDAGCVEAAVMGGMQASRAICGVPHSIAGEDDGWLAGRG